MYLKRLELSGFKSFAKLTTLEFPSRITAIVGPNGSGKSNIAESLRWVLGEQSMKSLRGKRGEDLIWNGSPASPAGGPQVPRLGKASAALLFDNKDGSGKFMTGGNTPFDFEEIAIMRKIFRDGMNEYYLNDSQVRLKDIVELIARMGLGETKHNIIGQGEVDKILLSSPRDRREMLEEALGLRVYQLKKHEAERKLEATEVNMKQAETLVREIAPHLKFLKSQAQKAEARESVHGELRQLEKIYFVRERASIAEERKGIEKRREPFLKKREEIRADIMVCAAKVGELEKKFSVEASEGEDKKFAALERRRREIERELGRLEGRVEMERERAASAGRREVDIGYVQEEIREFIAEIRNVLDVEDRIEAVRMRFEVLIEDLERLLDTLARGGAIPAKSQEETSPLLAELAGTIKKLGDELAVISKEIEEREAGRMHERKELQKLQASLREEEGALRVKQDEERDLILEIERFRFEEERLRVREDEWKRGMAGATLNDRDLTDVQLGDYESAAISDISRKIERLRARLEEIGGIDQSVVQEFKETEARHSFLAKEIDDLKQAASSLKSLIIELDEHIKKDFHAGFLKIKEEFHNYFRIIFGGGKASLQLVEIIQRVADEDGENGGGGEIAEDDGEKKVMEGIDISVDLPRKRIKGLAMLSGGERALTSIALLFAITSVNPPPFLVLDETDAALDEANSQRYAAILKELAKQTQLLLVTHNRETMKCAGVLYGVTMGDDGVSKLLSLKLEEAEVYTNR
ncbi:MAG: AAA family ATPase [Candidatus Sungbacteria bacterium]|nr:AAA family ATPase [Candidatus Sungbacteria bacterium]